jgi:hypothetical protein
MKCPTCNQQISAEANFCPRCGAAVGVSAQNPSSDIDATAHNYKPIFKGTFIVVAGFLVCYLCGGLFLSVIQGLSDSALQVASPTSDLQAERGMLNEHLEMVRITSHSPTPIQIQEVVINARACYPYTAPSREELGVNLALAMFKNPKATYLPITLRMGQSIVSTCFGGSLIPPEIVQVDIATDKGPVRFTW